MCLGTTVAVLDWLWFGMLVILVLLYWLGFCLKLWWVGDLLVYRLLVCSFMFCLVVWLVVLGFRFCGPGICYFAFWFGVDLLCVAWCFNIWLFVVALLFGFFFNSVVRCWVAIEHWIIFCYLLLELFWLCLGLLVWFGVLCDDCLELVVWLDLAGLCLSLFD